MGSNFTLWVINSGSMSSLKKELSELSNTHLSVYTYISAITLSFYSSTCPLYMGNLIMSPTWQISLVVLSICYTLPWVISVSCSLFKDSSHYLIYSLIQSPLYLLSFSLCLPSFAQFLVTLVIRWRIYCLPYHSMVQFQHFLMTKT